MISGHYIEIAKNANNIITFMKKNFSISVQIFGKSKKNANIVRNIYKHLNIILDYNAVWECIIYVIEIYCKKLINHSALHIVKPLLFVLQVLSIDIFN